MFNIHLGVLATIGPTVGALKSSILLATVTVGPTVGALYRQLHYMFATVGPTVGASYSVLQSMSVLPSTVVWGLDISLVYPVGPRSPHETSIGSISSHGDLSSIPLCGDLVLVPTSSVGRLCWSRVTVWSWV